MDLVREPEGAVHPQIRHRLHFGVGDGIAIEAHQNDSLQVC